MGRQRLGPGVRPRLSTLATSATVVRRQRLTRLQEDLLSCPGGTTIRPSLGLPHGIREQEGPHDECEALCRWHDGDRLASDANESGAVVTVRFADPGCVS